MEEGTLSRQRLDKGHHAGGRHRIAGPQGAMPELLQVSLEANQRGVGTSTVFLGVVPNASKLLFPVDGQYHRIEIEGESSAPFGQRKELSAQLIVQADELTDGSGTHPFEESAQGGLVGEPRQAQQGQEGTVVLQNFCLVDASQAGHDGVQKRQDEVGSAVIGVASRPPKGSLQEAAKAQLVAKTLQQHHSPEVGQMGLVKGKMQCSQGSRHDRETRLGRIRRGTQT